MGVNRQPFTTSPGAERFPFDVGFQIILLRLLVEDESFAAEATKHLKSDYFESDPLAWMYGYLIRHRERYGASPSVDVLFQATRDLDPSIRPLYSEMVDRVRQAPLRDCAWLKDQVLDFVRRNLFVRAMRDSREAYNSGQATKAYDVMMSLINEVRQVEWDAPDQSWFFEELAERQARRLVKSFADEIISTGFPWLDKILGGGLSLREMGCWQAYAKIGKSTILANHGMEATRRHFPTLHIVLEGSREYIENRYDTCFAREAYQEVRAGRMTPAKYSLALKEFNLLKGMLVIRSFVDEWDVSILHVDRVLHELERTRGWRPKLVIIDYLDLMTGRHPGRYKSETDSQRAAYRDGKRLANRGYAIWTASQAQRPRKIDFNKAHTLMSSNVADTYEKIRAVDFWGSLNQTLDERAAGVMRLYAEMYRENEADKTLLVRSDFETMRIYEQSGLVSPSWTEVPATPALGYKQVGAF